MKKTIIHVGLHKTATTFLQNNVWPTVKTYTYLSRPYTQHNHAFNRLQYADDTVYSRESVVRELERIGSDRLLISDESLSGKPVYFSYINRSLIARRLSDLFPDAEIILFLRDQKDILLSHYSSYIKMPYGKKPISKLFYKPQRDYSYSDYRSKSREFRMDSLYYNTNDYFIHLDCFLYSPLVQLYQNLFKRCHVFLYEDFKRDSRSTIRRFESILGEPLRVTSEAPRNRSLSLAGLEKRRQVNRFLSPFENRYVRRAAAEMVRFVPSIGESRDLRPIVEEMVGDYYVEDSAALRALLPDQDWKGHGGKY